MKNILKSQSGNIAIAMLLAVIGAMSGVTISSMAVRDTVAAQAELENTQALHFLRAETNRGQAYLEVAAKKDPNIVGGVRTALRTIPMQGSHFSKTYSMQSQVTKIYTDTEAIIVDVGGELQGSLTGASLTEYGVKSLVETKTGAGHVTFGNTNKTMVRKYGELTLLQDTGPVFMYFTDNELSPNDEHVYFYGYDVINGPVHCNTDIQIKKAGGDPSSPYYNQGWPTFLAVVTTSGEIIATPPNYPEDEVFQGGLKEHYDNYEYPTSMAAIKSRGALIGGHADENKIVMVEVNDRSITGWTGQIYDSRKTRKLWPNYPMGYPYADGSHIAINSFTTRDTIWSPLSGTSAVNGKSYYTRCKLWLKGEFGGFQTWASTDTMWLIGNLKYQHTNIGDSPVSNRYDMLGLVSEESIIVKYAYLDPEDSLRYYDNLGSDSALDNGIWIYAAMAALGKGVGNRYEDGVFTFEYQHPHGSIPAVKINLPNDDPDGGPILFDWIDLHRNYWPQTTAHPWPAWLDYPWYNPIWPEAKPYLERGTINIWGGVNQRRRGYVHRNYYDNEYPSNGIWNPPIDYCGATSSPANAFNIQLYQNPAVSVVLQTRHFTGAQGNGVGYKKNYNYDTRMYKTKPPDWPEFKRQGERLPLEQGSWLLKKPPRALI